MPSFLSKLLGRKKLQGLDPSSVNPGYPAPLLEGKFEAISPNVSPSAAFFTDPGAVQIRGNDRPKDKESPFYIFRARARGSSDVPVVEKAPSDVPHLSLNLPITKDRGPSLDVVFESDPDAFALSSEAVIRERRLTPHESLALVRACSQVIIGSGLETLGIMHPHWHSTSPAVQQRLISLYLLSLASTSPDGVTSPTSPTAVTTFESELQYTRSPHDVAAVLRWGLRHLKLEGDSFGKESGDWTWYSTFTEAERAGSYPRDAFPNSLIPQLPAAHAELLLAILDIISSLSTRSEANGSSGSKLSKFFGLWLLTSEQSTEGDDWSALYDRWDRAGRILEHLFLARIRNDAHDLPRRLTDLVEHYPYDYGVDVPKNDLLPRPRFSTRQFDALFVQLDTEYTGSVKPKSHPLRLIADAFHAQSSSESATTEDGGLWDAIKKASFDASEGPDDTAPMEPIPIFGNVFSDETIRLLSLIPADASNKDESALIFALRSPVSPTPRSFSLPETPLLVQSERGRPPPSGHAIVAPGLSANNSTAPTTALPETPTDWLQFSNQGFGTIPGSRDLVAKLWDDDVEKTVPLAVPLSRKSSHRAHSRHSSVDDAKTVQPVPPTPAPPVSKVTFVAKVKLDEAFIDFWTDSLLDPISKRWPRFVLCQLKPFSPADASATPTPAWLIIEQRFVHRPPVSPVKEEAEVTVPPARPRASSPHPSSRAESSRLSTAFSIVSKKRFGLFTGGNGDPKSPKDKTARLPQVGEYGEVAKGTEDGTAATEKPEEVGARDNVDRSAPSSTANAAVPVAVVVSAAAVVSAAEEVKYKENDLPAITAVSAPSELVGISVPKAHAPVKDEHPHGATSQNGLANDEHHDEEQPEPEAATPQGPSTAEPEPVPTDDTVPAIQAISANEGPALADAVETTVAPEEPAPAGGEVIVENAQPDVEAATPEPETIPASLADDTATPSLENAESAAAQAGPAEEPTPSAEPNAEHDAFVTQSAEEGLPSQATPQIQDPVIDEQLAAGETTPIPEASASESIPAEDLATSHEDEAVAAPPESVVADDAPVTGPVSGGASAPSENSPSEVPDVPVTEPVPEPEPSTQSSTNVSTEPDVFRAEYIDAGEPDTVVIAAGDASIANPVDEVSGLKAEADIVAEDQAPRKESESVIPIEEPSAPVPEIFTSVIEEPAPPTEAEIPVEAPAPAVQETDVTTEETTPAAAETPAPTSEPATDNVPALEVTALEVADSAVETPAPAPVDDVPEDVSPVAADALAVESASTIEESTPSVEDLSAHDQTLAAEQSPAVPEERTHLPEETASATAEPLAESAPTPEELALVTEAAAPAATEAPAELVPATEEAAPATTEVPAEPTSVSEVPAPIDEATALATIEAPTEPAPVTDEAAPVTTTTEAPADPACILEETAPDAEAVAPATENSSPEQFTPDLNETPAPPDEPGPVHEEEPVPEPSVEDPAPVHEDPAPTSESAMPTADDTPAECVGEGAEGSPSAETAAAGPASSAEEDASGLEGTVGAEPAAEEDLAATSGSETPAIAAQEFLSVETNAASEQETPVGASVSSEATDATNAEPNAEANESADDA